jgi:hypothetical protein
MAELPYPKLKKPNNSRFYYMADLSKNFFGLGVAGA